MEKMKVIQGNSYQPFKNIVIPAKAGIQRRASARHKRQPIFQFDPLRLICSLSLALDSRFRGNDSGKEVYGLINAGNQAPGTGRVVVIFGEGFVQNFFFVMDTHHLQG